MRTPGSNGDRLDKAEKDINRVKKDLERDKANLMNHIDMHIKDDLSAKRFPGSDKPMFTYEEIGERYGVSKSYVQRQAEENGLNRRGRSIG